MPNQSLTRMEMMNSCYATLYECLAFKLEVSQVLDTTILIKNLLWAWNLWVAMFELKSR